jgi:spore coat polysaccharide biosynthesis protein SpsF
MILPFYKDKSILEVLIDRFKREIKNKIPYIIATTVNPVDDKIQEVCERYAINYFRGPEDDVLLRFIQASEKFNFEYIIRICADNPLLDISGTLDLLKQINLTRMDYAGFKMKNTMPSILSHLGFWGEVVSLNALKKAHNSTNELFFREHVTNYIYRNTEQFHVELVDVPGKLGNREDLRLTVDTQADFEMLQDIYLKLMQQNISLDPVNIVNFLDRNSEYLEMMKKLIDQNKK